MSGKLDSVADTGGQEGGVGIAKEGKGEGK
jgi:hypothetical protein